MTGWIANTLNIAALVLVSRKQRIGWLFGIAAEVFWILRAHEKGDMHDLMFISAVYCCIAVWSWIKWGKA